ncbi:PLP-dependent aminotransferase family protein [Truepera radiovictrix]|uniref:Transcriptional regulator, GntR family n=1 Tax=Truepera radiovictrix (strain DSM 17093 / CIP 108686 / LMG 22925 / RQ-24) TaxID=649638 RepID=D7CX28_TRURR|nr:PLP-dependent aminotransferase family protein [Truepera radiovictrix]ADI14536.1 putative transcriptional regulator, GntR family [Truepera radiovictrix DSM 17093]WMT56913.1 PLP-dependent aminotransferase family protein [Truepera radiovictrix]
MSPPETQGAAVTVSGAPRAGVLELSRGHPSADLLPRALLARMRAALEAADVSPLQYGAEAGDARLREAVAAFLAAEAATPEGARPRPERLFITAGASQALALLCTLFTRAGDRVLVEDPTYHLALAVFRDHRLQVVSLPPGEARLEGLEAALARFRPKLVYLVPSFANPTGETLDASQRERLLEACARSGALLVADEVYRLLGFAGAPPPTLAREGAERVVSLGSFSKILAPGLRLGWLEADPALCARLERSGLLRSGGGLNPFVGALTYPFVAEGALREHLQGLRRALAERAAVLGAALRGALPAARCSDPDGGYFVWLELPGQSSAAARARAQRCGVDYLPGPHFSPTGAFGSALRLSFAPYPPALLREAAERLAAALPP